MPVSSTVPQGRLIAVDWGTSRLRAMLLDADGRILAETQSSDGISVLSPGDHEPAFEQLVGDWPRLPAIMAGMVGSRQGWHEAAYVDCPATATTLARNVLRFTGSGGRALAIVPGILLRSPDRDADVVRGEETQIVGLLCHEPSLDGVVVLPGTHSKWMRVRNGAISDFQTYLTGELFNLLSEHSFLRHSVAAGGDDLSAVPDFAVAVRRLVTDGLPFLASIFSVRARQLVGDIARTDNLAYLSGLLIGGEIAAAGAAGWVTPETTLRVVGADALANTYRAALALCGLDAAPVDGSAMVVAGLFDIARRIELVPEASRP